MPIWNDSLQCYSKFKIHFAQCELPTAKRRIFDSKTSDDNKNQHTKLTETANFPLEKNSAKKDSLEETTAAQTYKKREFYSLFMTSLFQMKTVLPTRLIRKHIC